MFGPTPTSAHRLLPIALLAWLAYVAVGDDAKTAQSAVPDDEVNDTAAAERIRLNQTVESSLQQKLAKRITVNIDQCPLKQLLENLAREGSIPLAIDHGTLKDDGISLDVPVTLHVSEITLRSALRLVLGPHQLQTIIRDELLTITTTIKAAETLETRVYDVGPLLLERDFTELLQTVSSCVEPDSWDEVGGSGSIREFDRTQSLIVRAPQRIHESIALLLSDLESAIQSGKRKQEPDPVREREASIQRKLLGSCSVDSDGQPLERIVAELTRTHQIPIWIDQETLQDEGVSFEQQVNARLTDVRIESALSHLLRPFELTWIVEDEVLKVTTVVRAAELLQTRVYDVRDLARKIEPTWPPTQAGSPGSGIGGGGQFGTGGGLYSLPTKSPRQGFGGMLFPGEAIGGTPRSIQWETGGYDLTELIDAATSTILPESWDEVGGAGSIRAYQHALVVRQTDEVHRQIQTLLESLRTIQRRDAEQDQSKADPQELKRVVYDFRDNYDYSADELAKLIPGAVAPESWKAAGGRATLLVQPSALVITQTPAIHKEIVKLLFEVVLQLRVGEEH